MTRAPALLARGPWDPAEVDCRWIERSFEPDSESDAAADAAIAALRQRGSPSHDGLSARLVDFAAQDDRLSLSLQPMRWSLRLVDDAADSLAVLCVVRASDGRWLAGRRAPWVASWAGRWALGAGGSVEVGEHPVAALVREVREEWSIDVAGLRVEALVRLPSGLVMLVGTAALPEGVEVTPDAEHDAFAWWPADPERWPAEGDEPLRRMAALLSA